MYGPSLHPKKRRVKNIGGFAVTERARDLWDPPSETEDGAPAEHRGPWLKPFLGGSLFRGA